MNTDNRYYVYVHYDKDGKIFYCGKGSGDRLFSTASRNPDWREIAITDSTISFEAEIIYENLTEEEALIMESAYIKEYGLENLSNRKS